MFETPADLGEYLFRITDNCGRSYDRYTVTFSDGTYLGLNGSPTHPLGFSQAGEDIDPQVQAGWVEEGDSIDLALGDLPEGLAEHIMFRCNEGFQDFVERVEKHGFSVAKSRDRASIHEGLYNSFGDGLYLKDGAYMIRIDGMGPDEDYGPYETAIEALRATLPDRYTFSGDEYFSTVDDICRTTADPDVLAAIAALEEKVHAEYEASRAPGYFG
jgi:hypothetical protein